MYGPQLTSKQDSDSDDDFGPALPPDIASKRQSTSKLTDTDTQTHTQKKRRPAGPTIPPPNYIPPKPDSDSDDDFGPILPPESSQEDDLQSKISEIEARARTAKEQLELASAPKKVERGDWMLVPPEVRALGVGLDPMKSRQFSRSEKVAQVDNSGWTETPHQKSQRGTEKRKRVDDDAPRPPTLEETQTQKFIQQYNQKNRPSSLLDSHVLTYTSSPAMTSDAASTRGFDRDRDLVSRRIDPKARSEMVRGAKELDGRFGHGGKTFL